MKNWLPVNRHQQTFLPPSADEWLPGDHLARFVVDIVDQLDLSAIIATYDKRPHGSTPYHPSLLLALLLYGYATGVCSSRKIERATHDSVAFRYIASGYHPDHDTIASFRRRHLGEIERLFVEVLLIAREMGLVKMGTVALDGTKIKANASKHRATSYKRARELERQYQKEVSRLLEMAESADGAAVADGLDIPAEIVRREERIRKLREAQEAIRARHGEKVLEEHEENLRRQGEKVEAAIKATLAGKPAKAPPPVREPDLEPDDKAQYNHTDPDSRIMPDKGGFSQAYNGQVGVDTGVMLIVCKHVSQQTNDKRELLPAVDRMIQTVGPPAALLGDGGYYSGANVENAPDGIDIYLSPGRIKHNKPLEERLRPPAKGDLPKGATAAEKMRHKLDTEKGRSLYRLRKMTVEPVIGIIKQAMGFRQFLLRGLEKVSGEWGLVCLAYNLKRMNTLKWAKGG
jgi:transposase